MTDDLKEFAENCLDANEYGSLEYRLALAYLERPTPKERFEALKKTVKDRDDFGRYGWDEWQRQTDQAEIHNAAIDACIALIEREG